MTGVPYRLRPYAEALKRTIRERAEGAAENRLYPPLAEHISAHDFELVMAWLHDCGWVTRKDGTAFPGPVGWGWAGETPPT